MRKTKVNMIIDIHTHSGINLWRYIKGYPDALASLETLNSHRKNNGVDYCVVMPEVNTLYYDPYKLVKERQLEAIYIGDFPFHIENNYILNLCQPSDYLLPFVNFQPNDCVEKQTKWIENLYTTYKLYGVKIHTWAMHCTLKDLMNSIDLFDFLSDKGLPVMLHGEVRDEKAFNIRELEALLNTYPKVHFCVAHLGMFGTAFYDLFKSAPENLFADISPFRSLCLNASKGVYPINKIITADYNNSFSVFEKYVSINLDHLLFGSDFPYCSQGYNEEIQFVKELPPHVVQKVCYRNSLNYLRLDLPGNLNSI